MEQAEETEEGGESEHKVKGKSQAQKDYDNAHSYSIVQVKLHSILRPNFANPLGQLFETLSCTLSRIVFEGYLLANYHVLRFIDEGKGQALPKLNHSFFNSCCLLVTNSKGAGSEELKASADQYRLLRPGGWDVPDKQHLSHAISSLAKLMAVMTQNHIVLNVYGRLVRYVKIKYNLNTNPMAKAFIRSCFLDNVLTWDQREFKEWIEINPYFVDNVKNNINHFIVKLADVLHYYETPELNGRPGVRKFTLLPTKGSYVVSFFFIDKTTLPEILILLDKPVQKEIISSMISRFPKDSDSWNFLQKRLSARSCFSDRDWHRMEAVSQALWDVLFDTNKYQTRTRKFAWKISTNGYAASVTMQKPKEDIVPHEDTDPDYDSPTDLFEHQYDKFIGIDPGQTFVCTAYAGVERRLTNGRSRSDYVQISTGSLKHEAKEDQRKSWERKFRERNPEYSTGLNALESLKTADLNVFQDRVRSTLLQAKTLLPFSQKKVFRAWRFKTGRFRKRALAKAVKMIVGQGVDVKKTLIGFGDWSQQDGLKGNEKAPVKTIRRTMRKMGLKVLKIDEHRTSKCCSACAGRGEVENVYYGEGETRKRCHQVVRCNNSECEVVWQRDLNASRNIRSVLMAKVRKEERPPGLKRQRRRRDDRHDE